MTRTATNTPDRLRRRALLASGVVHIAVLVLLAAVAVRTVPARLRVAPGGIVLLARLDDRADDAWHLHAPGVPADHQHADQAIRLHHHPQPAPRAARLPPVAMDLPAADLVVQPSPTPAAPPARPVPEPAPHEPAVPRVPRQPTSAAPVGAAPEESASSPPAASVAIGTPAPLLQQSDPSAAQTGAATATLPEPLAANPAPPYPRQAYLARREGRVLLEADIDTRGRVVQLRIIQTSGTPALDQSALATVRRWQFIPARQGPTPVPSTIRIPVRFRLSELD